MMYNDRSGPTSLVLRFRLDIWLQEVLPPSPNFGVFLVSPFASDEFLSPNKVSSIERRLTIIAHLVIEQRRS